MWIAKWRRKLIYVLANAVNEKLNYYYVLLHMKQKAANGEGNQRQIELNWNENGKAIAKIMAAKLHTYDVFACSPACLVACIVALLGHRSVCCCCCCCRGCGSWALFLLRFVGPRAHTYFSTYFHVHLFSFVFFDRFFFCLLLFLLFSRAHTHTHRHHHLCLYCLQYLAWTWGAPAAECVQIIEASQ